MKVARKQAAAAEPTAKARGCPTGRARGSGSRGTSLGIKKEQLAREETLGKVHVL